MANIHVLERSGAQHRIVLHIAVPAANNGAGVSIRSASVNSKIGGTTILSDGDGTAGTISAAEKTNVTTGAVLELVRSLDLTQGGTLTTGGQIAAFLDDYYAAVSAEVLADLQFKLAQFGRTR